MKKIRLTAGQIKARELAILQSFDSFCKENGMEYILAYGTLLGAVRHAGFIPWDDDIDVVMARPDYEKLIRLAIAGKTPEGCEVQATEIDGFVQPFAKIVDRAVSITSGRNNGSQKEWLWIDVFPVDGVPESKLGQKILYMKAKILGALCVADQLDPSYEDASVAMRLVAALVGPIARRTSLPALASEALASLCKRIPFGSTGHAGVVGWGGGPREVFPISYFKAGRSIAFESNKFPASNQTEQILSQIYGADYMELPPVDKRVSHELIAYVDEGCDPIG